MGRSGASLGRSGAPLGPFLDDQNRSFFKLGSKMVSKGPSEAILGRFGVDFGGFGEDLGGSWKDFGQFLDGFWKDLGQNLGES